MGFAIVVALALIVPTIFNSMTKQLRWYDVPMLFLTYGVWIIVIGMRDE